MNPIEVPLRALLDELDRLEQQHEELSDTLSREELADAVHGGFLMQEPDFELPSGFGLFTQQGNDAVRAALAKFLQTAIPETRELSPAQRLAAFQDADIQSATGSRYDEHFGHVDAIAAEVLAQKQAVASRASAKTPWWKFWR